MQSSWPLVPLSDLAREVTVGHVGSMADQYVQFGVPFLRSLNIRPHKVDLADTKYISRAFHTQLRKSALRPGDVVIVRTGKPGTCAVIPESLPEANCSDVVIVRCGERLRPSFFAYWMNSMAKAHVDAHTVGAVQQHFNVASAKLLRVPVPPLGEQDILLEPLCAIDDRIDLLRQTNATLESIAQALFKSWFVDFDPVRAKVEGREPEGMDAATAALFPDEFEDSALGLIPKAWAVEPIGDLVECIGGSTPDTKNPTFWEPAVHHWTSPKDLSGATSPVLLDTERKVSPAGLAKISSGLLPAGSLLMSSRAPIGYLTLTQVPVAINQGYIAMPPGGRLRPLYLYFWCQANMDGIKGRANGSTFMEISKKAFRPMPALLPPQQVIDSFVECVGSLFSRLVANERQARILVELREALLPRLISGKLRLPEAHAQLEEATA